MAKATPVNMAIIAIDQTMIAPVGRSNSDERMMPTKYESAPIK